MKRSCAGIRTTWPRKGYPCGAVAKYEHNGKWYCAAHYAKAVKESTDRKGKEVMNGL